MAEDLANWPGSACLVFVSLGSMWLVDSGSACFRDSSVAGRGRTNYIS